jgi:hypothetical protein
MFLQGLIRLILGAAMRTLDEILYAADGKQGDDEEKRNEEHPLFLNEIGDSSTFPAAHLFRRNL